MTFTCPCFLPEVMVSAFLDKSAYQFCQNWLDVPNGICPFCETEKVALNQTVYP